MADDAWSFDLSSSASRSYQSIFKSQADFYMDFEDFDGGDDDDDDEIRDYYQCPFCSEDFDYVGLCCHIDEDHPTEAKSGVCPICANRVRMNMVGHMTTQHGNFFKGQHRLKPHKGESHSVFSVSKELQHMRWLSLIGMSSSAISTSKMVPDPLLSFLYNAPAADKSGDVQLGSSTEVSLEEENSENTSLERDTQAPPLSDKDQEEKTMRIEFVQGLLLSTIIDDGL